MTVEAKLKVTLQDNASKGLSQLEQKIKQIQQRILEDTKKLNQDSANADKQSNEKKKKGWSELEAHIKQIQQRIADAAKKAAQDAAEAERHAKEQKKKGWSELEAHIKRIQQQLADDAKRKAEQEAAADRAAKEKRKRGWSELEAHVKQIQQRIVDDAKRKAEQEAEADRQAKEKRKRGWSEMEAHVKRIQQKMVDDAKRAAQAEADAAKRALKQIEDARKTLGARSHAQITEQMNRTRQAYQTLARSGVLSWREQAQAADAMRRKVTELTNEMGHLTRAQKAYAGLQMGATAIGAVTGGLVGAAIAAKEPVTKSLEFDRRIDYLTLTAYPKRDIAGKAAGAKELTEAVEKGVKASQLDKDKVTDIADMLISGGIVPIKDIYRDLPYLAQTAKANNAEAADVGRLTNVLYGTDRVHNLDELKKSMNIIIAAGQAGGFEYKNQVMHLPSQLAAARSAGMTGLKGVRDVATLNETSFMVAGTPDQAGVATHNLLIKLVSKDTAKDYSDYMEDKYKVKADLYQDIMKARSKGMDALGFWQALIDKEMKADPTLAKYKKRLDNAKSKQEAQEALDAIGLVGKGSIISNFFQEMRGQNAMLGYQNSVYREKVRAEAQSAMDGRFKPNESNLAFIQRRNVYKIDTLSNTLESQQKHVIDKQVTERLANAAQKGTSFAEKHPYIATMANNPYGTISAVGGAVAGGYLLKGAVNRLAPTLLPSVGSSIAANITVALSRLSGFLSTAATRAPILARSGLQAAAPYAPMLARASAVGTAGYVGYQAGGMLNNPINAVVSKLMGHESSLGSAIHEFVSGEATFNSAVHNLMGWKPDPVRVDTHVTVALAPGLIPVAQTSKGTNTGGGTNTATVGGKGNLWTGAPK